MFYFVCLSLNDLGKKFVFSLIKTCNIQQEFRMSTILLSLTCQGNHCVLFFLFSQELCEGMLLLGCIKEVTVFELVISLPNGLTGFVPVTQISDAYSELLSKQVTQGELLEVRLWVRAVISVWDVGENKSEST